MPHSRTPDLKKELSAPFHPLLLGVPGGNIHFRKRMDVQSWLEWTYLVQLAQVVPRGGQSPGLSWKCMTTCLSMYVCNPQRLHGVDSRRLVTEVLYPGTSSSPFHTQTRLWKPRSQQLHLIAFFLAWLCWNWYPQGSSVYSSFLTRKVSQIWDSIQLRVHAHATRSLRNAERHWHVSAAVECQQARLGLLTIQQHKYIQHSI